MFPVILSCVRLSVLGLRLFKFAVQVQCLESGFRALSFFWNVLATAKKSATMSHTLSAWFSSIPHATYAGSLSWVLVVAKAAAGSSDASLFLISRIGSMARIKGA